MNIFTTILNSPISYSTYAAVLQREDRLMTRKPPKRGLPPMHPGELLREEILPALDRPKTEIAKLLGVSRQTLYDVLKERQQA